MGQRAQRGRVYRRCGCQDGNRKQLGPWCPRLAGDIKHGTWTYAVDLAREPATRKPHLAPNTYAGYATCVERDLIPAFGRLRLLDLRPKHIDDWVTAQLEAKRGRVTVYRAVSTLRNALNERTPCAPKRQSPHHCGDRLSGLYKRNAGRGNRIQPCEPPPPSPYDLPAERAAIFAITSRTVRDPASLICIFASSRSSHRQLIPTLSRILRTTRIRGLHAHKSLFKNSHA
ncbi:tyrosine-type recombinase/integrase [Kitasatospora sp. NPDC001159]